MDFSLNLNKMKELHMFLAERAKIIVNYFQMEFLLYSLLIQ